jgi:hypothetical protein
LEIKEIMQQYTVKKLIQRLQQEHIINAPTYLGAHQVLHYWMRTGKLKLRQAPHSGYHYVTDTEIEAVIKEFSLGGQGSWSYED